MVAPPVELVFWLGFALPWGLVLGVARTAVVLLALLPLSRVGS